jgi:vibriolysin
MSIKLLFNNITKTALVPAFLAATLTACGGVSSPSDPVVIPDGIPTNTISHTYFRDQDGDTGKLAGSVTLKATTKSPGNTAADSFWIYWADAFGNKVDDKIGNDANSAWLKISAVAPYNISIPAGTIIPANVSVFIIYPHNEKGEADTGTLINFHDFIGNAQLSGPGGNEYFPWYYGLPPATC